VNWPSTPSLKVPRPSPSTPAPNKATLSLKGNRLQTIAGKHTIMTVFQNIARHSQISSFLSTLTKSSHTLSIFVNLYTVCYAFDS
jgi:hypothetical protein